VKAVFSSLFREDLREVTGRYAEILPRLGEDFEARVKAAVRTVLRWEGGDHVGPHGFPCRRCRPFPYLLYYKIEGETVYVLGLVHERRHPDFLKKRLAEGE
jgi:hypothetical protein